MLDVLAKSIVDNQHIPATIILQNIILPNSDIYSSVEKLFLKLNYNSVLNYKQNIVELKKGGSIRFDTYFNVFSVQKWKNCINIKRINIRLYLKGAFQIKLLAIDNLSTSARLINQKFINVNTLSEVTVFDNIDIIYKNLLYLEIKAISNNCLFKDGYFYIINIRQNLDKKLQ
ncbi:hypothetical protein FNW02_20080 [Komarekiella sp. 'clone 1']|uniref:Galactofuranosyltransferase GlfT2 N-terminal domain-containing protein n=1 Tax=Komarekiella delphini-convector SJRDD-AB1 TaxID=2593771 RepID=A0AA40VT38_9NOST|nr:hypothetical protein [Komarekiella delphini-convector]MBD6618061.1 hypothetical protein [Komarekiella delphini-convector SJRDD-AB1]